VKQAVTRQRGHGSWALTHRRATTGRRIALAARLATGDPAAERPSSHAGPRTPPRPARAARRPAFRPPARPGPPHRPAQAAAPRHDRTTPLPAAATGHPHRRARAAERPLRPGRRPLRPGRTPPRAAACRAPGAAPAVAPPAQARPGPRSSCRGSSPRGRRLGRSARCRASHTPNPMAARRSRRSPHPGRLPTRTQAAQGAQPPWATTVAPRRPTPADPPHQRPEQPSRPAFPQHPVRRQGRRQAAQQPRQPPRRDHGHAMEVTCPNATFAPTTATIGTTAMPGAPMRAWELVRLPAYCSGCTADPRPAGQGFAGRKPSHTPQRCGSEVAARPGRFRLRPGQAIAV
jgi:hypothetical protein